jgi:hypothetical protein
MLEPDIGQEPISPIEALGAELDRLAQLHRHAVKDGRHIDAAVVEVRHAKKFAAWCAMQKEAAAERIVSLESSLRSLKRRINWWHELNYLATEPSELSSAQQAIFEGADFIPSDWNEAKEALSIHPEFAEPQSGTFDSWNKSFLEIEAVIKLLVGDLRMSLSQFETTDARDPSWDVYRDKIHPEISYLETQLNETWAAAEFSKW